MNNSPSEEEQSIFFWRTNMKQAFNVKKTTFAALFLALCMVLPFLTGQIPQIGSALSPMHIPVLLCGFVCGWQYGLIVGFISPLLRFVLFGMPPIFPTGVAMAFELAAYGVLSGILYRAFDKKVINIYISLVLAMLGGRIVWGVVQFILSLFVGFEFTFATFLAGAFVSAVPGIICHIAIIPVIVIALRKTKLMQDL